MSTVFSGYKPACSLFMFASMFSIQLERICLANKTLILADRVLNFHGYMCSIEQYLEASRLENFLLLNELHFSSLKGFISLTAEANDMLNTGLIVDLLVFDT